jgi:WhiB family redox-sensing transcriptional regulator
MDTTLAACKDHDPSLWFSTSKRSTANDEAIAICATCPIREACLEYSLEWAEDGIWGGLDARQRKVLRRERGIKVR